VFLSLGIVMSHQNLHLLEQSLIFLREKMRSILELHDFLARSLSRVLISSWCFSSCSLSIWLVRSRYTRMISILLYDTQILSLCHRQLFPELVILLYDHLAILQLRLELRFRLLQVPPQQSHRSFIVVKQRPKHMMR
jgi:hypothetical protein